MSEMLRGGGTDFGFVSEDGDGEFDHRKVSLVCSKNRKEDFILVRLGNIDVNTMIITQELESPEDITPVEVVG